MYLYSFFIFIPMNTFLTFNIWSFSSYKYFCWFCYFNYFCSSWYFWYLWYFWYFWYFFCRLNFKSRQYTLLTVLHTYFSLLLTTWFLTYGRNFFFGPYSLHLVFTYNASWLWYISLPKSTWHPTSPGSFSFTLNWLPFCVFFF